MAGKKISELSSGNYNTGAYVAGRIGTGNYQFNLQQFLTGWLATQVSPTFGGNGLLDSGLITRYDEYGNLKAEAITTDTALTIGESGVYTGFLNLLSADHSYISSIIANAGLSSDTIYYLPDSPGILATQEYVTANYVNINGGTMTSPLSVPLVVKPSALVSYGAVITVTFGTQEWNTLSLTGDIAIQTANRSDGQELSIAITADSSTRNFTWSESWVWIGGYAPSSIGANKRGILSLRCFGTLETDVYASWSVEP